MWISPHRLVMPSFRHLLRATAHAVAHGLAARSLTFSRLAHAGMLLGTVAVVVTTVAGAAASSGSQFIERHLHLTTLIVPERVGGGRKDMPRFALPRTLDDLATIMVANMSLDDKLGQLFIPTLLGGGWTPSNAAMVSRYHPGGYIVYAANTQDAATARSLNAHALTSSPIPPLAAIDEEGGGVDRLVKIFGPMPSARQVGVTHSTGYAQSIGARIGRNMASLGFNVNFAPDVDVQLVSGPDLGSRNFGGDPQVVSAMAEAWITGLQAQGVLATPKHFPGLGAARIDAHEGLPVISRTRDQLDAVEFAPYRALLATGQVQAIMTTDELLTAIDERLPAELSPAVVTGVLRHDLGFDGVAITDALYMAGVSQRYSMPEAGVLALIAGNDMLEGPMTSAQLGQMIQAIKAALTSGRLSEARIDQSVHRIIRMKMRMGLIPVPLSLIAPLPAIGSMTPRNGTLKLNGTPLALVITKR